MEEITFNSASHADFQSFSSGEKKEPALREPALRRITGHATHHLKRDLL